MKMTNAAAQVHAVRVLMRITHRIEAEEAVDPPARDDDPRVRREIARILGDMSVAIRAGGVKPLEAIAELKAVLDGPLDPGELARWRVSDARRALRIVR